MKTGLLISVYHRLTTYYLMTLTPGLYRVFAYGRLHNGVGYPVSRDQFTIAGNSQGKAVN